MNPRVCPSGVSGWCGVELGHRPVELLHRALPGLPLQLDAA